MSKGSNGNFQFPQKSFWHGSDKQGYSFFCPQCRIPRRISLHPKPMKAKYLLRVGLSAAVLTAVTWPFFGMKGLISFFPLWGAFELVYRIRLRSMLPCSSCGFDPYLYLNDIKKARHEMERFWRKKFSDLGVNYPGDPVLAETQPDPPPSAPSSETLGQGRDALLKTVQASERPQSR